MSEKKRKRIIIYGSILGVIALIAIGMFFYATRYSKEDNQIILDDLAEELKQYENIVNAQTDIDLDYISVFQNQINGYDIREDETISNYLQAQSKHTDYTVNNVDFWGRRKDRARVITTITHADMKYVREQGNILVEQRITHMESDRGLIIHHLNAYADILLADSNIPFVYDTVSFKVELIDGNWQLTDESKDVLATYLLGKYKYKFLYEDL